MNYKNILSSNDYIYTSKVITTNILENKFTINISNEELFPKYINIITQKIINNKPYKFIWFITINNQKINVFKNLFSIPIQKIIHISVVKYINSKINLFQTTSNKLTQPGITIKNNNNNKSRKDYEIYDTAKSTYNSTNKYKIHLMVKLKYLFWTIDYIIKNEHKFVININNQQKPLFGYFKIHTNFESYTILKDKTKFDNEILYQPNIIFYQYKDEDKQITKECFKHLVKLLLELFPDELNISSNRYSKFTFKLNKNLFLCIGDGIDKINKSSEYTIPIEYDKIIKSCNTLDKKECKNINKYSKELSNHILCKYIDNKCTVNNITSYNYLVKTNNNSINDIFNEIKY